MKVDWKIDGNNYLDCDYFPYVDGCAGSFIYDYKNKTLEIESLRVDLGQLCRFRFTEVKRYAFELWGGDVFNDGLISKLSNFLPDGKWRSSSVSPWEVIYRNCGVKEAVSIFEDDKRKYPDAYLFHFTGNMDGQIVVIFEKMELF